MAGATRDVCRYFPANTMSMPCTAATRALFNTFRWVPDPQTLLERPNAARVLRGHGPLRQRESPFYALMGVPRQVRWQMYFREWRHSLGQVRPMPRSCASTITVFFHHASLPRPQFSGTAAALLHMEFLFSAYLHRRYMLNKLDLRF